MTPCISLSTVETDKLILPVSYREQSERALTIHLALIREDNFAASTGWVDGQCLLEALLYVRTPHPLSIIINGLVCRVAHPLNILGRAFTATPAAGINGGGWDLQAEAWSRLG